MNFIAAVTNGFIFTCVYTRRQHFLTTIVGSILETMAQAKQIKALKLTDEEDPIETTKTFTTKYTIIEDHTNLRPEWIFLIVLLSLLTLFACYWIIVLIILPMTRKSSICRFLLPCRKWNNSFLTPATDILLDIVHIQSGEQIRVFLTTISAPPCSLSFTGSVQIQNFTIRRNRFLCELHIDWHNCLLYFHDHVISLPSKDIAFAFQPNLLTEFSRPGPYNIQLLARHMDALLAIPHSSELDFVTASDLLALPYSHPINPTCPYQQIYNEVLSMMPLADTPSASESPTVTCSPDPPVNSQDEHFV